MGKKARQQRIKPVSGRWTLVAPDGKVESYDSVEALKAAFAESPPSTVREAVEELDQIEAISVKPPPPLPERAKSRAPEEPALPSLAAAIEAAVLDHHEVARAMETLREPAPASDAITKPTLALGADGVDRERPTESEPDIAPINPTPIVVIVPPKPAEPESEPRISMSDLTSPTAVSETLISTITPRPVKSRRKKARRWVAATSIAAAAITVFAFARQAPPSAAVANAAPQETPVVVATGEPAEAPPPAPAALPTPESAATAVTTTTGVNVNALPTVVPAKTTSTAFAASAPPAPAAATNVRDLLRQGVTALRDRDYSTARQRYEAALARDPGNVEAINGLGDVALMTGDLHTAKQHYAAAAAANPSYFPARLSLADAQWDLGERSAAQAQYADIAAQFPDRAPDRVQKRASAP